MVTPHDDIARWAAEPIAWSAGSASFTPLVISPRGVPVVTDLELAVLSAMAHGQDADIDLAARIGAAASSAAVHLDPDRALPYYDLWLYPMRLSADFEPDARAPPRASARWRRHATASPGPVRSPTPTFTRADSSSRETADEVARQETPAHL
ncbi:MAG: hypothetical protein GXP55_25280, partial [Deltaproteobacteria bacterium]|nr:hypothetical protein [Deltaproteobacteria bacterium]